MVIHKNDFIFLKRFLRSERFDALSLELVGSFQIAENQTLARTSGYLTSFSEITYEI